MRILLDECVPRTFRRDLVGHDVWHVSDMGWAGRRNGELLQLMLVERFDALLTVDQNLGFQQNVQASGIGVVVVLSTTNRLRELRPFVQRILAALAELVAGELVRIGD